MDKQSLQKFIIREENSLYDAAKELFASDLQIPLKFVTSLPVDLHRIFGEYFRPKLHDTILSAFFIGMVDDDAFTEGSTGFQPVDKNNANTGRDGCANNNANTARDGCATNEPNTGRDACATLKAQTDREDYEGLVVFALDLKPRNNTRAPTRSQLAELTRSFNRAFNGHPVTILFRYIVDETHYISLANCERTAYQQQWREGEKPGKVSLLRDINPVAPHAGHLRILNELQIPRSGRNAVTSFNDLYQYWQRVLNADILNKEFYRELSDWYFWALKNVEFPEGAGSDKNLRNATSTIRLITRVLFVWFLKEKGLIPETLFRRNDLDKVLIWNDANNSTYYKSILQNLFFATLNREMDKREFRKEGQHHGITNLYRYENYFNDTGTALQLFQDIPFLNGGLFECLDKSHPDKKGPQGGNVMIRIDSFSDRNDNPLCVPDELFFGNEREVDLSAEYGQRNRRSEKIRGLIPILNGYKFTVTENTPLEQDVALDPELLGKVFENLLASYNPETQSTARKQTGSYYTPREIVDYMVTESLVAYLKSSAESSTGFQPVNPKNNQPNQTNKDHDNRNNAGTNTAVNTKSSTGFQPVTVNMNENNTNTGRDGCATMEPTTFKPFDFGDPLEITERNLPHWEQPDVTYFVTFRMADSIPQDKLKRWQEEREAWLANHNEPFSDDEIAEYNRLFSDRIQQWLDAGHGQCHLKRPEVSKIVADALQYFEDDRYTLTAWVVMPNHVHALVKPIANHALSHILHSWKSYTAVQCNKVLGRSGQFWQDESYDHAVRSERQLRTLKNYIQENPGKANLAPHQYRCKKESSTGFQPVNVKNNQPNQTTKDHDNGNNAGTNAAVNTKSSTGFQPVNVKNNQPNQTNNDHDNRNNAGTNAAVNTKNSTGFQPVNVKNNQPNQTNNDHDNRNNAGTNAAVNTKSSTGFQPVNVKNNQPNQTNNDHDNRNNAGTNAAVNTKSNTGFQPVNVNMNENNTNTGRDACATNEPNTGRDACATLEDRLRLLISDTENQPFKGEEVDMLIDAIENIKILDPACGSGAFPMGVLHRLVHTLKKLDPDNERWKQRQIDAASKVPDPDTRERLINEIEENFRNYDDYGRKLYLIESCIYGVDIQPIAVQIAKLRFFISLVVDQSVQPGKNNQGIRALPNLETKFVAANTLVGLNRPKQMLLPNQEIDKLEKELADIRHRHFNAKTPATKRKYREKDRELRQRISQSIARNRWLGPLFCPPGRSMGSVRSELLCSLLRPRMDVWDSLAG